VTGITSSMETNKTLQHVYIYKEMRKGILHGTKHVMEVTSVEIMFVRRHAVTTYNCTQAVRKYQRKINTLPT
jgi:hypothetical protein